jgi:hypothetical protein
MINDLRNLISETFQDLKINEFELIGKGKTASICLINNEIVFKVPLEGEGGIEPKKEADVLKFLEGKLDIEIPKILYSGTSENGLYYNRRNLALRHKLFICDA